MMSELPVESAVVQSGPFLPLSQSEGSIQEAKEGVVADARKLFFFFPPPKKSGKPKERAAVAKRTHGHARYDVG
jgi:hypothetical protein